jgi:hypothetical protein
VNILNNEPIMRRRHLCFWFRSAWVVACLRLAAATTGRAQESSLEAMWNDLAGADARRAYTAIWALTAKPDETVAFFQTHLKPAVPADRKLVEQFIRDLSDKRFAVRKKANADLDHLGELAADVVAEALKREDLPLEGRQRCEKLLASLQGPVTAPDKLRAIRAAETLEYIGTPAARRLLQRLADGAPAARLTEEARESLARLVKRGP